MTYQDSLDAERYYGEQIGLKRGLEQGRVSTLAGLVRDGLLDAAIAAERAGVSEESMRELAASMP